MLTKNLKKIVMNKLKNPNGFVRTSDGIVNAPFDYSESQLVVADVKETVYLAIYDKSKARINVCAFCQMDIKPAQLARSVKTCGCLYHHLCTEFMPTVCNPLSDRCIACDPVSKRVISETYGRMTLVNVVTKKPDDLAAAYLVTSTIFLSIIHRYSDIKDDNRLAELLIAAVKSKFKSMSVNCMACGKSKYERKIIDCKCRVFKHCGGCKDVKHLCKPYVEWFGKPIPIILDEIFKLGHSSVNCKACKICGDCEDGSLLINNICGDTYHRECYTNKYGKRISMVNRKCFLCSPGAKFNKELHIWESEEDARIRGEFNIHPENVLKFVTIPVSDDIARQACEYIRIIYVIEYLIDFDHGNCNIGSPFTGDQVNQIIESTKKSTCAKCGISAMLRKLSKCTLCTTYYCGVECQKADWHFHKLTCGK